MEAKLCHGLGLVGTAGFLQDRPGKRGHKLLREKVCLGGLKAELTWVMFMKMDMKATVVPDLFTMQQKWREMKDRTPQLVELTKSLVFPGALGSPHKSS